MARRHRLRCKPTENRVESYPAAPILVGQETGCIGQPVAGKLKRVLSLPSSRPGEQAYAKIAWGAMTRDPDRSTTEFVRLLKQHERQLNGYIMALVSDWHVADEIAQETSVRLWEQFHEYRREMDFGVWARAIARFQVLTYRKRTMRERMRFSQRFVDTVANRMETMWPELNGQLDSLRDCMSQLSDDHRRLIQLCYRDDRTIKQVAQDLGRTYHSTYKAVERVRKALHDCIEKKTRAEERT